MMCTARKLAWLGMAAVIGMLAPSAHAESDAWDEGMCQTSGLCARGTTCLWTIPVRQANGKIVCLSVYAEGGRDEMRSLLGFLPAAATDGAPAPSALPGEVMAALSKGAALGVASLMGDKCPATVNRLLPPISLPPQPAQEAGMPPPVAYSGSGLFSCLPDIPGWARFVPPKKDADPSAWKDVDPQVHKHFATELCADINSSAAGYRHVDLEYEKDGKTVRKGIYHAMGPAKAFKVVNAKDSWTGSGYGGRVRIELDDFVIDVGHLNEISSEVYRVAGTAETLPAGTYIGTASELFGATTGAHIHMQAKKRVRDARGRETLVPAKRWEWMPVLRGDPTPMPNDGAPKKRGAGPGKAR